MNVVIAKRANNPVKIDISPIPVPKVALAPTQHSICTDSAIDDASFAWMSNNGIYCYGGSGGGGGIPSDDTDMTEELDLALMSLMQSGGNACHDNGGVAAGQTTFASSPPGGDRHGHGIASEQPSIRSPSIDLVSPHFAHASSPPLPSLDLDTGVLGIFKDLSLLGDDHPFDKPQVLDNASIRLFGLSLSQLPPDLRSSLEGMFVDVSKIL